ncbi:MAG: glycosyltransferase family 2 protein [Planctomycetota bacterium]
MKKSVCMATYNGARFIRQQLESILPQLESGDEVVINDDCSTDPTCQVIAACSDARIRLETNPRNLGPIRNFEKVIARATGELIFLSDQDDIWLENKVSATCAVFAQYPDVTLVFSNAELVNAEGQPLGRLLWQGALSAGVMRNLVKNRFLGCTLAFREGLRECALPFPDDLPMHDMWLGLVNALYGRGYYIAAPLIQYRVHSASATFHRRAPSGRSTASLWQKTKWRLALMKNLGFRQHKIRSASRTRMRLADRPPPTKATSP